MSSSALHPITLLMLSHRARTFRSRLLIGIPLLAAAAYGAYVLLVAYRAGRPRRANPRLDGFVGSRVCAECHAELAATHAETAHARALTTTQAFAASHPLPASKWLPDPDLPIAYRIARRDGQLGIEVHVNGELRWQPMAWAFGSGTQAMTPVGRTADGRFVESPVSFYRRSGWDFTVGFLGNPPAQRWKYHGGNPLEREDAAQCFECHATGVQRSRPDLGVGALEFGVQCESCHGPGAHHVDAARRGQRPGEIRTPGQASGRAMVYFCATCHRRDPPSGLKPHDPVVVRFAPVGLLRSRCFKESGGRLSCTTCHAAHRPLSHNSATYRQTCLGCHRRGERPSFCPVQPAGDCVACHMPKRIIQRHAVYTDHWIRVLR